MLKSPKPNPPTIAEKIGIPNSQPPVTDPPVSPKPPVTPPTTDDYINNGDGAATEPKE